MLLGYNRSRKETVGNQILENFKVNIMKSSKLLKYIFEGIFKAVTWR